MALRVLLADESTTIKKVMQLALQDFGVEVKSVPVGTDVVEVAVGFKPNIVFADVLLAKRSGYEVSLDLKSNPQTKQIPTVLMWSGFMEIDAEKATESRCDDRLEKPFDADHLRSLVKKLVPALAENKISEYLTFNHLPAIEEFHSEKGSPEDFSVDALAPPTPTSPKMEEDEEFQQVPLPKLRDLSTEIRATSQRLKTQHHASDLTSSSIAWYGSETETPLSELTKTNARLSGDGLDVETKSKLEVAIKAQAREVLEQAVWKVLPEICERVVREELARLLKDIERFP